MQWGVSTKKYIHIYILKNNTGKEDEREREVGKRRRRRMVFMLAVYIYRVCVWIGEGCCSYNKKIILDMSVVKIIIIIIAKWWMSCD